MRVESLTCITGKKEKAEQIGRYLNLPVEIADIDLPEKQDLNSENVVLDKANEAFKRVDKPVIVDDSGLQIHSMGRLPGTFVKFFLEELGTEKICRLTDFSEDRSATAFVEIGFADGKSTQPFRGEIKGSIAKHPRGENGFGWDTIFIPDGYDKTRGEMNDEEYDATSPRKFALEKLEAFLKE